MHFYLAALTKAFTTIVYFSPLFDARSVKTDPKGINVMASDVKTEGGPNWGSFRWQ